MRWLDRFRDDRGVTLVIIAFAMVVLIGFVGLVLDVGAIYAERRELSRGADAAVLAIAEDCGRDIVVCTDALAIVTAEAFANANADDGAAGIESLVIDLDAQTVRAVTKTIDPADGTDQFKLLFMRVLGIDSMTVTADATAIWGYPLSAGAFPLIISDCEWPRVVASSQSSPVTLYFHQGGQSPDEGVDPEGNPTDCAAQAGTDVDNEGDRLPGGFGWLDTDDLCYALVRGDSWIYEDPGAAPSTGCSASELEALFLDKTIHLPYFEDVRGLGSNGEYQISGIGAFHVTGYNFGGQNKKPTTATAPCSGDDRCIRGYFEGDLAWEGELGGENRGLVVIRLIA